MGLDWWPRVRFHVLCRYGRLQTNVPNLVYNICVCINAVTYEHGVGVGCLIFKAAVSDKSVWLKARLQTLNPSWGLFEQSRDSITAFSHSHKITLSFNFLNHFKYESICTCLPISYGAYKTVVGEMNGLHSARRIIVSEGHKGGVVNHLGKPCCGGVP